MLALVLGIITLQMAHTRAASPPSLQAVYGTLAPLLAKSQLQGHSNPQQPIELSLGLHPRNERSLSNYVREITHAQRHFLTPMSYNETFRPLDNSYNQVSQFLTTAGLRITHTYNHHLTINVSGTIGQVEKAFHVTINNYTAPDGHSYYANATDPQLPTNLASQLQSISGLNNSAIWQHALRYQSLAEPLPATTPMVCPAAGSGRLTPDQFASAYNLKSLYAEGLHGEGQTIALFELNSFEMSDLKAYAACYGQSQTAIEAIPTGTRPVPRDGGALEVVTDAELILSTAPALKTLKIYQASNDPAGYLGEWAQIVQDAMPIVSMSWGACEAVLDASTIQQEHTLLQTAVARGQNIFVASGDSGSDSCLPHAGRGNPLPSLNANDPAAQPFVTAVGGSTLSLTAQSTYGSETTWNNPPSPGTAQPGGASGGGISQYWEMPEWQSAPGVQNSFTTGQTCHATAGKVCRQLPDVALHADPRNGYPIYCTAVYAGCNSIRPWIAVAGTSAAAPLWAAMMALTNQLASNQKQNSPGFIAPLLYQIARVGYTQNFHDITTGNNDYGSHNAGRYPATAGYDLATGLGSYNAYNLVHTLASPNLKPTPISTPKPRK
jgi:kumamolisin